MPSWRQIIVIVSALVLAGGVATTGAATPGSTTGGSPQSPSSGEVPEGLNAAGWQQIRETIRRGRYDAYRAEAGGYHSANPAHGFNIDYRADGTTELSPREHGDTDWNLSLRLTGIGYSTLEPVGEPQGLSPESGRLTYDRARGLTEWWQNGPSGPRQWFRVDRAPEGRASEHPLRLHLALETDLAVEENGRGIVFRGDNTEVTYSGLAAWDATGRELPARMSLAGNTLALVIDDRAARYPVTIDPVFQQQAYLKASNTHEEDLFGLSVAVSGNTVVVGARGESSAATGVDGDQSDNSAEGAGAAYVFARDSEGNWSQEAYLKASNTDAGDGFGRSVAIAGDTIVVGAAFEDSAGTGVDGDQSDNSAFNAGAAYVFVVPDLIFTDRFESSP